MGKWNDLSMTERARYLKAGVDSGIYNPNVVAKRHNIMAEGWMGDITEQSIPFYMQSKFNPNLRPVFDPRGYTYRPSEPANEEENFQVLDRDADVYLRMKANEVVANMQREMRQNAIDSLMSLDRKDVKKIQRQMADSGMYDKSLEGISKAGIKQIQRRLIQDGYLDDRKNSNGNYIEVDGIVGKKTIDAYNRYNRDKEVDGIVGPKTIRAYIEYNNIGMTNYNKDVPTKGIDGCAQWITKKYESAVGNLSKQNGVTLNAWQMPQNIVDHGGQMVYNIYDESFNDVKNVSTLKRKTEKALKENPVDYSMLNIGDIVGIYLPSSNMHDTALKEGTTKNTHVGIVTGFDEDGMPIVEHNIHTSHRRDRADNLTGSLFGKAQIATVSRPKTTVTSVPELSFKSKPSRFQIDGKYNSSDMQRFMDSMEGAAPVISQIFPEADMDDVMKAAIGVLKRETNFMTNKVSDQVDKSPVARVKEGLKNVVRSKLGKNKETKSSNLTKFKLSTLNADERKLLGIHEASDLENPEKAGLASVFTLAKSYDYFKRLQEEYPQLGITNDDIMNLTILSYNQGMSKLYDIGFDKKTGKKAPEELEAIRRMASKDAKIKDISSTNYKYLKYLTGEDIAETVYDIFGSPYTPYIAAARSAIEDYVKEK